MAINEDLANLPSTELQRVTASWPDQRVEDYQPYMKLWRSQFNDGAMTAKRYAGFCKVWCNLANGQRLDPVLILKWNELMRNGRNGTTIMRWNMMLRAFLNWLRDIGIIQMNPSVALARLPQTPPRHTGVFSHAEYTKIVAYGTENPDQFAVATWLVVLSYHTGLSLVDCCDLRWDEVHIDPNGPCYIARIRQKMKMRSGKKALCTIPIVVGGELWNWIIRLEKQYRGNNPYVHPEAPLLYADKSVEPKRRFQKLFARALTWRGVKGRTFRSLRNTFCSRLLNAGVDSALVAKMTGHSNLSQLLTYATPDIRTMQAAVTRGLKHVTESDEMMILPLPEAADGTM